MRSLFVALAVLLTSCSKPYYAQKNGDLNVAVAKKRAGCAGKQPGRVCELIDAFDEADESLPLPKKRARYFGFLSASHNTLGVPVALIVERGEGDRMKALLLPWTRLTGSGEETAKDFLKNGSDGGNYDVYFESPSRDPYAVTTIDGAKSIVISDIGTGHYSMENFIRRRGKRIFLVQMAGKETTEISAAGIRAPVWAGELRQLD